MFMREIRIKDKEKIRKIMDSFIIGNARHKFIAVIFDKKTNCVYEVVRPLSVCTTEKDNKSIRNYSLTNMDSGYSISIGIVNLDNIGYIEID